MKKSISLIAMLFLSFILIGCSDDNDNKETGNNQENNHIVDKENNAGDNSNDREQEDDVKNTENSNQTSANNDEVDSTTNKPQEQENDVLSEYSYKEIEYARIWLQLGANQEVDGIRAEYIPAGEPLNPDDKTSVNYPEDVVQLSGTRLVDGSVTYSSNGDGTINLYNVPKRWDGKNPAGEDVYNKIIDHTESVSIDTGDDQEVKKLIQKLEIN